MAVATPAACGVPQLGQNATLSATMVPHLVQCGMKFSPKSWSQGAAFVAQPSKSAGRRQAESRKTLVVCGACHIAEGAALGRVKSGANVILWLPPRKWRNWQTRQP